MLSRGAVVLAVDALALAREMPSLFRTLSTKKMTASRCVFSRSARARYRTRDARSLGRAITRTFVQRFDPVRLELIPPPSPPPPREKGAVTNVEEQTKLGSFMSIVILPICVVLYSIIYFVQFFSHWFPYDRVRVVNADP